MSNVLDLQGLPEGTQALAAQMMAGGSCISLLSVVTQPLAASPEEHAKVGVTPMGNCISLLSVTTPH